MSAAAEQPPSANSLSQSTRNWVAGIAGEFPSYDLMGVRVHAVTLEGLCCAVEQGIASGKRSILANHNLNSIYLYHQDPTMREFFARATLTFIDGMPLVLWGRVLGFPLRREHRLTAVDWLRPLLRHAAEQKWRLFFLGARPGVAERAAARVRAEISGLNVQTAHGFFDGTPGGPESMAVLARIREARPHVLIVGMGMPRQEHWIVGEFDRIPANVILNQGAFLDYLAGDIPTPPRWLAALGFEWLARLTVEPRRMWRRYLLQPWALLPHLLRDWVKCRARHPVS